MRFSCFFGVACWLAVPAFAEDRVSSSGVGVDVLFEAYPFNTVVSPKVNDFEATHGSETDDVEGVFSSLPNLRLGLGLETPFAYFDATAGGGVFWNFALLSPTGRGDLSARFKLGRLFTLGPHVGLIYFGEPLWFSTPRVEFSDAWGYSAGLGFTVGVKAISFSLSVDYLSASFDVEPKASVLTNDDDLDISGIAIQLGILCRF